MALLTVYFVITAGIYALAVLLMGVSLARLGCLPCITDYIKKLFRKRTR